MWVERSRWRSLWTVFWSTMAEKGRQAVTEILLESLQVNLHKTKGGNSPSIVALSDNYRLFVLFYTRKSIFTYIFYICICTYKMTDKILITSHISVLFIFYLSQISPKWTKYVSLTEKQYNASLILNWFVLLVFRFSQIGSRFTFSPKSMINWW